MTPIAVVTVRKRWWYRATLAIGLRCANAMACVSPRLAMRFVEWLGGLAYRGLHVSVGSGR